MISLSESAEGTGLGLDDGGDLGLGVEDSAGSLSLEDTGGSMGGGIMLEADDLGGGAVDASEETLITDDAGIVTWGIGCTSAGGMNHHTFI